MPELGSSWNFGMAATVLAMSVESSVLEQAWNCLNADEAGQRAIVIPRSVATRDLLFVDKQIPRCARDDNQVSSAPCLCSVRPRPRSTVDACLENGAFAAGSRNSRKTPNLEYSNFGMSFAEDGFLAESLRVQAALEATVGTLPPCTDACAFRHTRHIAPRIYGAEHETERSVLSTVKAPLIVMRR